MGKGESALADGTSFVTDSSAPESREENDQVPGATEFSPTLFNAAVTVL